MELSHKHLRSKDSEVPVVVNQLLEEGSMADKQWLICHGISKSDIAKCQELGLLAEISPDVFRRPTSCEEKEIGWDYVINSLQSKLGISVHAGGVTALESQGIIHYLRLRPPWPVYLYTYQKLPDWIYNFTTDARFFIRQGNKLFDPNAPGLFQYSNEHFGAEVTMSNCERAMCEVIDELPEYNQFHEVDMYMSYAYNFCPKKVQSVLEACKSFKVKRLYLFFAERRQMPWLDLLDLGKIDLGKGKRQIMVNGKYDSKYRITVPDNLDAQAGDLVYAGEQF